MYGIKNILHTNVNVCYSNKKLVNLELVIVLGVVDGEENKRGSL